MANFKAIPSSTATLTNPTITGGTITGATVGGITTAQQDLVANGAKATVSLTTVDTPYAGTETLVGVPGMATKTVTEMGGAAAIAAYVTANSDCDCTLSGTALTLTAKAYGDDLNDTEISGTLLRKAGQLQGGREPTASSQSVLAGLGFTQDEIGKMAESIGLFAMSYAAKVRESRIYASRGEGLHWYVDSVNGSDSNTGHSEHDAFATLAQVDAQSFKAGDWIHLARGSSWREEITLSAGVHIDSFGVGARPLIDGSDVGANGSFSKTDGRTNVYEITWEVSYTPTTNHHHCVWEDGVMLAKVADVATCDATPGSYYAPQPPTASDTIYVHASDSSDVTANSKVYELCQREGCLVGGVGSGIFGIRTRRAAGKDGSLKSYYFAGDCTAEDGYVHNMWVEGIASRCVCKECLPSEIYGDRSMFITFPSGNASTMYEGATLLRCDAIAAAGQQPIGFYHHTAGGANFVKMAYGWCRAYRCTTEAFGGANCDSTMHIDCDAYGSNYIYTATVTNKVVLGGFIDGLFEAAQTTKIIEAGATNLTMRGVRGRLSNNAQTAYILATGTLDVQYCSFAIDTPGAMWYWLLLHSPTATAVTFKHNVLSGMTSGSLTVGASTVVDSDYNVFYNSDDFLVGATPYASLAAWQSATGQDANSSAADPQFAGAFAAGDFSVASGSPAVAAEAGSVYDDTDTKLATWLDYIG